MTFKNGEVAEYGSKKFEENKAIKIVLDSGTFINSCGIHFPAVLFHQTAGFQIAGSCAVFSAEKWGYSIKDTYSNTTFGKSFASEVEALAAWKNVKN